MKLGYIFIIFSVFSFPKTHQFNNISLTVYSVPFLKDVNYLWLAFLKSLKLKRIFLGKVVSSNILQLILELPKPRVSKDWFLTISFMNMFYKKRFEQAEERWGEEGK